MSRTRVYLAFGFLLLVSLGVAAGEPVAFKKLNTMVSAGEIEPFGDSDDPVDIVDFIGKTPYRRGFANTIVPETKFRRTFEEGIGNCSERAFGLAWKLRQSQTPYQIIYLLPGRKILLGHGHTVIRLKYDDAGVSRLGVVDLLSGGLPISDGRPIDVEDLTRGSIPDFAFRFMTDYREEPPAYYGEFLEGNFVGYLYPREVHRYFDFIDRVYLPLGNEQVEKQLYDGIALLLGFLPNVYVPNYPNLAAQLRSEILLQKSALFVLRAALFLVPLFVGIEAVILLRSAPR